MNDGATRLLMVIQMPINSPVVRKGVMRGVAGTVGATVIEGCITTAMNRINSFQVAIVLDISTNTVLT